uniref:Uncharacterized protein n=1 Tax=Cucumis melo TaxID=3656 RepID=A0A9I9EL07_CUCME
MNDERCTTKTPTLTPFFSFPHSFFSTTETHGEETHIVTELGNQGQGRFHGYGRKLREKENEKLMVGWRVCITIKVL